MVGIVMNGLLMVVVDYVTIIETVADELLVNGLNKQLLIMRDTN